MRQSAPLKLLMGIKRRLARRDDSSSHRADAEFKAKRPGVLERFGHTCQGCRYTSSKYLDVHHRDDDHHNNSDDNLCPACHTCHPYQHIGEVVKRTDIPGEGLGKQTRIAFVPELAPADLNLLQRAIGVALLDEAEKPIALEMIKRLAERATVTQQMYGSCLPGDFAAAFASMDDSQYAHREDAIKDLRVLFSARLLEQLGREFVADFPTLSISSWQQAARSAAPRQRPDQGSSE